MSEIKLAELGKSISDSLTLSEERTSRFVDAFVQVLRAALSGGKEVALPGLGSLTVAGKDGKPFPAMYKANLIGDVCAKLREPNETNVKTMLEGLLVEVRREMLEGRKVILDDVGTFEVRRERPQIERQAKGHRLIKPAMTAVRFQSTKTVATPMGEGKLIFTPADDLKKKVDSLRESTILLVVPERDFFVKTLEYYFENAGWEIETFESVEEAKRKIESGKAYLVVLDAGMPDYQKFVQRMKMVRETNSTPLILLFPSEQSYEAMSEAVIVGDENLSQPFEFRKLLDASDSEILRAAEEQLLFVQQLNLHLPTDEPVIEKTINDVQKLLEASGLNEEGQVSMSAAFREAVLNAAQHGNRWNREKKVEVQYLLDREKVTMVIHDRGNGFNHELYVKSGQTGTAIAAARERHAQGRMGGLGILLMLRCCDRLEYNQKGNQITLSKFLKPQS